MARLTRVMVALAGLVLSAAIAPAAAAATPTFPGPPVVVDLLPTRATLTWQPPDTDPLVTYYRIYRVTTRDGQPYEQSYNASYSTSLLLALLDPDTEYTFFVETGDQTSNGLRSPSVTFRTPRAPAESEPPTSPGTPEVTAAGPNTLTLSWAASTDNDGVAAYYLYRTRYDGGIEQAGLTVTETTWSFTRLLPDYDYAYHVVAVDHAGNRSSPSGMVGVRTPADPRSSCEVEYAATGHGDGTFLGEVTLHYTGDFVDVYTVRLTLPAGQRFVASWDHAWAQVGTEVVLWYDGFAGGLSPGVHTLRFTATGNVPGPPPTGFRLNGQPCR